MFGETLKTIWYEICRVGCRIFCFAFFPMRVYGVENIPRKGPLILASNHQSYMDPVFCGLRVRRHLSYLARESLFGNWFFAWLIRSLNAIPLRRDEADMAAVRKVLSKLKEGRGVCLYPEGTRTYDGRVEAFKPGLGLLCRRGGAAVVPVLIDGAYECWPRHQKMFKRGPVTVTYGRAVTAEQAREMGDKKLAEHLTETVRQMQRDCRIRDGKEPYDYGQDGGAENSERPSQSRSGQA
ncbi:MAG: 1-acyl-sn-glycerol-3-phosphate acyltransferase [Phycisphaerales bacterium]|nr:MAG: 1-acyl-sn-glycerol-3-phosphate acyltransferase [Phycisphaerales bacterium]